MKETKTKQPKTSKLYTFFKNRNVRTALSGIVIVGVFSLGLGFGNGTIQLPINNVKSANTDLPAQLDYSSVDTLYSSIRANYDGKLDEAKLIEGLKHGLAEATGDPYTVFFTQKEADKLEQDLNNTFSGIGAELGKDADNNIHVIAPIAGTPAEKAGVRARDIIATIDGTTTVGMSVDDAVSKIRGEAGTQVKLQLVRGDQPVELTITRQSIQVPSVTSEVKEGNIGYIKISTFATDTSRLMTEAATKMKQAGVKGIVLDMRNNPGGAVEAAVSVASEWLPFNKTILQEKRGNTVIQSYQSSGNASLEGIPTVVLINEGSASASEIVAAALKDNGAARIIGEKSYGKGSVQQLINFKDGSQLKVTIASWYRPNGKNINKEGIGPDDTVKLTAEDATAGNDTQLKAATDYLNR